jgi:Holliday junction resolvase RusA-like endonuclease
VKIQTPKPPSVNHIYGFTARGGFARSYITKEGVLWFTGSSKLIGKTFKRTTIADPVEIWIELYHKRRQDVDNVLKPILDLLSKWCVKCQGKVNRGKGCHCGKNHTVLLDDDQVYKLNIEKHQVTKDDEEYVTVEIMGFQ